MKMIFQYNKRIRICALLEILEIDPGSEYLSRGSDLEFEQQEKDAKDKNKHWIFIFEIQFVYE